jgi:cytochrome c553
MKNKLITMVLLTALFGGMVAIQGCEKESEENETNISRYGDDDSHNMSQNCMNCHKSGGQGEGWFNAAGTVYNAAFTNVQPNGTVKLYTGPDGTGTLKYTIEVDAKGNFYTTEDINFGSGLYPSITGTSGDVQYMSTTTTIGACNSCHGVSTNKIFVN